MTGLVWTTMIWGVALALLHAARERGPWFRGLVTRESLALLLALLGTYSIAGASEAEEVLRNPLVQERIIRGGMSALSLAISLPLLVRRLRSSTARSNRALSALGIYLAIALLSTIYSAAPLVTAAKVFELSAGLAPIAAMALEPDARTRLTKAFSLILILQGVMLTVATVGFFVLPQTFSVMGTRPGILLRETLRTPWAHSNTVSAFGALLAVYGVSQALRTQTRAPLGWAGFTIGVSVTLLASGRQGVAMMVAGIGMLLFFQRRRLFLFLLGPVATYLVVTFWDSIFSSLARNRPESLMTFTGRLYWWEAALDAWMVHPWTGWGYAAGGRFVALTSIGTGTTTNVHSGYIETLVGVGILGSLPLLYVIWRVAAWAVRSLAANSHIAVAALVLPLMLRTAVSLGFAGWLTTEFALFALAVAIADVAPVSRRLTERMLTGAP